MPSLRASEVWEYPATRVETTPPSPTRQGGGVLVAEGCSGGASPAPVPIERSDRAARRYRIHEGTSEIQKLIIARQMLGRVRAA
jgi:alkylation response protein AidB-like acyl-CoA dehydrogenase